MNDVAALPAAEPAANLCLWVLDCLEGDASSTPCVVTVRWRVRDAGRRLTAGGATLGEQVGDQALDRAFLHR